MWKLTNDTAELSLPHFSATIPVLEPWRGLLQPRWHRSPLPAAAALLQVEARELIAPNRLPLEVYVRGCDLIATYAPSEGRNVQTQIYWRVHEFEDSVALELILSAQTHLLDSRPQLSTISTLPTGGVFHEQEDSQDWEELPAGPFKREFAPFQATPYLFQPQGASYSYAEMVHPTDFGGARLERRGEETVRLSSQLFPERLEKGVIRRCRIRGLFLPRTNDLAATAAHYRAFTQEPLPLTT